MSVIASHYSNNSLNVIALLNAWSINQISYLNMKSEYSWYSSWNRYANQSLSIILKEVQ